VFRAVKAARVETPEEPKTEGKPAVEQDQPAAKSHFEPKPRREEKPAAAEAAPSPPSAPGAPLPIGEELLAKIEPLMRRNRRGPGGSGSVSFLARALKCNEADLTTAFDSLGLKLSANPNDQPIYVEVAGALWWLNQDSRGGVWINGREKKDGEVIAPSETPTAASGEPVVSTAAPEPAAPASPASAPAASASPLAAVRLVLKETKTGAVAGKVERVAEELGQSPEQLIAVLTGAGLQVPEKSREKPVFVEHAGEIFWFNKNAKDELWLNAKASKFADKKEGGDADGGDHKPRRGGRSRKKE
jgi:hypothetical protein